MSVYKIFVPLLFNRECMKRNVMTSFRILASFACFLRYFQTRITTTKFDWQKTGTHISQITTLFCLFFCYFVTGVEKWNLFFFQIMILEHLHFCFANHGCVSHLLRGQPHLLECYYRNSLIGTHVCVHPVSEWSDFFYPSVWILHKLQCFKQCQPCLRTDRGWGGGGRGDGQPNVDRPGQGDGGPKYSQICADILYGWPLWGTIFRNRKMTKGLNISRPIYFKISVYRLEDLICTYKLEGLFFKKSFFLMTWTFFHDCKITYLDAIFLHKKWFYTFFSSGIV